VTPPAGNVLRLREDPDYAMTAAEHLEEAFRLMGWSDGSWSVEILARDGHVEKAYPKRGAIGRHELHERRRDEVSSEQLR
jgi:hypothetical protein